MKADYGVAKPIVNFLREPRAEESDYIGLGYKTLLVRG